MSELMRIPKREPIKIVMPYLHCEVNDCDGLRQSDMILFVQEEGRVEHFQICGIHLFLFRGHFPANFFPLNTAPPVQWVAEQINQEMFRRQPPPPVYYGGFNGNFNYGTNSTAGGFYFRFG